MPMRHADQAAVTDSLDVMWETFDYLRMTERADARRQRITSDADMKFSPLVEAADKAYVDLLVYVWYENQNDSGNGELMLRTRHRLIRHFRRLQSKCPHERVVMNVCSRCRGPVGSGLAAGAIRP